MATPTFAAGLGVVVAAALAVGMTARTVLHFSGPDQGRPCAVRGCGSGPDQPGGAGTLASAKPGIRLVPSVLGPERSAQPSPSFTGGLDGGVSHAESDVVIDYQTTKQWPGGFDGQIAISGMPASMLGTWRLGFDYPGTRIVGVQGAQWQPTGEDSGVAEAETTTTSSATASAATGSSATASAATSQNGAGSSAGTASGSGQNSSGQVGKQNAVVITIEASGTPSVPSDCSFNDAPCSFSH